MSGLGLQLADMARGAEQLLAGSLQNPGPGTLVVVFSGGLLTSLGPCSLSLLPITLAYLAGFGESQEAHPPWQRSISFASGIVAALVLLGLASVLMGRLYGRLPSQIPVLVAVVAVLMGLNLLGLLRLPMPAGPDPERWRQRVPAPLAPMAAGLAFGLAATPCTTPVLAVLLAWIAQSGQPMVGVALLVSFGAGQVMPLLLAGTVAASLPTLLQLRQVSRWIPSISGVILITTGGLSLLSQWP